MLDSEIIVKTDFVTTLNYKPCQRARVDVKRGQRWEFMLMSYPTSDEQSERPLADSRPGHLWLFNKFVYIIQKASVLIVYFFALRS